MEITFDRSNVELWNCRKMWVPHLNADCCLENRGLEVAVLNSCRVEKGRSAAHHRHGKKIRENESGANGKYTTKFVKPFS